MNRVRIRNLRSLADTGSIEIKPLTLLVGANSSGKSSFLRVFPLLRQSTETRTRSGLLLNEPYVDYGLFPVAVRKGADPIEITLELETTLEPDSWRDIVAFIGPTCVNFSISFAQRSDDARYSYVHNLTLCLRSNGTQDEVTITASEQGQVTHLTINGYDATNDSQKLRLRTGGGVIPALIVESQDAEEGQTFVTDDDTQRGAFTTSLMRATSSIFHGRTLDSTRLSILRAAWLGSPAQMLDQMSRITDNGFWNQRVAHWKPDNVEFLRLRNLIIADRLRNILTALNGAVSRFARAVHYFEPVRARVQRDYVSRDVQVQNVEPDGGNVAMFLASLRPLVRAMFEDWTKSHFGFSVHPEPVGDGARVALRLKEVESGAEFNLADMGFGYSQMLPLLVQVWALSQPEALARSRLRFRAGFSTRGYLVAIEQPELHLHPGMQAKVADLLANAIRVSKQQNVPIRFVIETHSQTIVNRLGELIEAKRVDADDAQILLFERGSPGKDPQISEIRQATFDSEGVLKNWPFGFFLPSGHSLESIPMAIETVAK